MKRILLATMATVILVTSLSGCGSSTIPSELTTKTETTKTTSIYDRHETVSLKTAQVGDCISFGKYEQDNNVNNGKEEIEWLVLDIQNGKILVVSKYLLDCKPYHPIAGETDWQDCNLRSWLNDEFMDAAFSEIESAHIQTVEISTGDSYGIRKFTTEDRLFLLSLSEADTYFKSDAERKCEATDYAMANGLYIEGDAYFTQCGWWLRTTGQYPTHACGISRSGRLDDYGLSVDADNLCGIRPAMWIARNI